LEGSSVTSDFARSYRQSLTGFYFQDDWKFNKRLTLNLGLRYEFATAPTETHGRIANLRNVTDTSSTVGEPFFKPTRKAFSPRFGFAWDVFGDG
nr:TonB-dependent receptor [Acidobacteriota bacterium]